MALFEKTSEPETMTLLLSRRTASACIGAAVALPFAGFAAGVPTLPARRFEPRVEGWRTFDVTTRVTVADVQGATKVWLPIPDVESDYQRAIGHGWTSNAAAVRIVADAERGVRMLHAEFPAGVKDPVLESTSRFRTRNRAVDWRSTARSAEDPAVLRRALQPTELLPLDGIVRATALDATRNASGDVQKARAIYDWVVAHGHREPKVRGCGTGDIRTMLETGNLGGKCADLNAVVVGLCRAVGIPARDVYGLRLAPSAFGYRELGSNPANLTGAQHCRAEVYLQRHGWVAMDPADVLKVMRQETPEWIRDRSHPLVAPVAEGLFGGWEGNWVAYNTAHDVMVPGSASKVPLPFLMYPQGENASGRFDELAPERFRYQISAREVS
jgi:transglutaminase-like putative cysteine protease